METYLVETLPLAVACLLVVYVLLRTAPRTPQSPPDL